MKAPTIRDFQKRFPTEEACMEHLFRTRWGQTHQCKKCDREARYYRVKKRRSYECEHCGYQVYPTAGTPFENTRTSLRDWFYVMYLFCASRNGVSAKEVQRQIGVTYKTAWRMCAMIRRYMGWVDGDFYVGGRGKHVEIDETYIGGHDKLGEGDKKVVLGMVERGGDVITRQLPAAQMSYAVPVMAEHLDLNSTVTTDTSRLYRILGEAGVEHGTVNHSKYEWVRGKHHTNTIEAFWSLLKRGIQGTYIHVSSKHLQKYLWEFEFRYNMRRNPHLMFEVLLQAFPRWDPTPWPKEARQSAA